jgi:serine/threonine protein kinase
MRMFYVFQLCSALKKVHEKLILHRDLKPQNLLLARNRTDKLLLADFGGTKDERSI